VRRGDVIHVDIGDPIGSEAGFMRPGVVVVADSFLRYRPNTLFVVPLTTTPRDFPSHVEIPADEGNGLAMSSFALVEQMRAVSAQRCGNATGNVGELRLRQIVEILAMIVGI